MNYLIINNKKLTFEEIKEKKIEFDDNYFNKTINFCHLWLNKQSEFKTFTSGSTGEPKKITLQREKMIISANATIEKLNLNKNKNCFICLSTEHIAGIMMLVRAFQNNMNIVIEKPSSDPFYKKEVFEYEFSAFVPMQIESILKNKNTEHLNRIRNIIIGGAKINHKLEKKIQIIKSNIYETYGMTETISHIALRKINGNDKQKFFNVLNHTIISKDKRNCLVIKSKVIDKNNIVTNDIVNIISKKEFEWLGRNDNIINSGGFKVKPEIIEDHINEYLSKINKDYNFFIYYKKDNLLENKIICLFETKDKINELELLNYLKQYLKKYELPKETINLENFLYTKTGKINKIKTMSLLN